jgi:hypothetical protein
MEPAVELLHPKTANGRNNCNNKNRDNNSNDTVDFYPVDSGQGIKGEFWPTIPDEHWNFMPRTYSPWNSPYSWCGTAEDYNDNTPAGLIFVKVHKAASSTLAGVNLRIAHNYGRCRWRTTNSYTQSNVDNTSMEETTTKCHSHEVHDDSQRFHQRDSTRSFMYTSIRDPTQRALSWIFYVASNRGKNLTDAYILEKLQDRTYFTAGIVSNSQIHSFRNEAGAQVGYLHTGPRVEHPLWSTDHPQTIMNLSLSISRVAEVLQQYDLILIVERLHESLVVLQLLLGLNTSDILYLSAKQSGAYSYSFRPNPGCHLISKSFITPAMATFLSSGQWYAQNYQDFLLYKAANASLDLTINSLGRKRFNKALTKYKTMMESAKVCDDEAITPCTSEGVEQNETNCYHKDWGCGYPCLDRIFGIC